MFSDSGARAVAARGRSRSSWPAISGVKSISAPRAFAVWIACTIACALRSGSFPLVIWKIAVRINGSGLEEQIQLALTIQRGEIVGPTNMSPVYEYLRHSVPAIRPLHHLSALRPAQSDIIFFILHAFRSEEHTSELQSLMRISYAVFCLKKKK